MPFTCRVLQDVQSWMQMAGAACGFVAIVSGTFLLHTTKDMQITLTDLGALTWCVQCHTL